MNDKNQFIIPAVIFTVAVSIVGGFWAVRAQTAWLRPTSAGQPTLLSPGDARIDGNTILGNASSNTTKINGGLAVGSTASIGADGTLTTTGAINTAGGVILNTAGAVNGLLVPNGNVGIGTTPISLSAKFNVGGNGAAGTGIYGYGPAIGVKGVGSVGVYGWGGLSGDTGVTGQSSAGNGVAGTSNTGNGVAGTSNTGYAGYFSGKAYFSGNVGIGTSFAYAKLAIDQTNSNNSGSLGDGIYVLANSTRSAIRAIQSNPNGYAGNFGGNVVVSGYVSGGKYGGAGLLRASSSNTGYYTNSSCSTQLGNPTSDAITSSISDIWGVMQPISIYFLDVNGFCIPGMFLASCGSGFTYHSYRIRGTSGDGYIAECIRN